jgi:mannose/fructose-specific phosphotransferase system component IIA
VLGPIAGVRVVAITQGEPARDVEARLEEAVTQLESDGLVFLVDLSGSTPYNVCCRSCGGRSAVVTGMNLPMLFKLATVDRTKDPQALAAELAATGTKSIQVRPGAPKGAA